MLSAAFADNAEDRKAAVPEIAQPKRKVLYYVRSTFLRFVEILWTRGCSYVFLNDIILWLLRAFGLRTHRRIMTNIAKLCSSSNVADAHITGCWKWYTGSEDDSIR